MSTEQELEMRLVMLRNTMEELEQKQQQVVKKLQHDIKQWRRIANKAFAMAGGGCIQGCKQACMCTCGYGDFMYMEGKAQQEEQ